VWFEAKFPDLWFGEPIVPEKQQAEWDAVMVSPSLLFCRPGRRGGPPPGECVDTVLRRDTPPAARPRLGASRPPAHHEAGTRDGVGRSAALGVLFPPSLPSPPSGWGGARCGARPVPRPQGLPASRTPLEPPCLSGDDDGLFLDKEDPTDPDWSVEH
jgi:hypothetical protein